MKDITAEKQKIENSFLRLRLLICWGEILENGHLEN